MQSSQTSSNGYTDPLAKKIQEKNFLMVKRDLRAFRGYPLH